MERVPAAAASFLSLDLLEEEEEEVEFEEEAGVKEICFAFDDDSPLMSMSFGVGIAAETKLHSEKSSGWAFASVYTFEEIQGFFLVYGLV